MAKGGGVWAEIVEFASCAVCLSKPWTRTQLSPAHLPWPMSQVWGCVLRAPPLSAGVPCLRHWTPGQQGDNVLAMWAKSKVAIDPQPLPSAARGEGYARLL